MIQLELETPLGKALIEENSYSGEYDPECPLIKKCALIMNRSDFLKRASSSGSGISVVIRTIW